jgi:hypothetical protein
MYVLKTRTGNFDELAEIAKNIFEKEIVREKKEKPKIVLLNGTFIDGLARSKIEILSPHFEIIEIGNAKKRNYSRTIIYDLTNGKKNKELNILKERLGGDVLNEIPDEFIGKEADFIIILGEK